MYCTVIFISNEAYRKIKKLPVKGSLSLVQYGLKFFRKERPRYRLPETDHNEQNN